MAEYSNNHDELIRAFTGLTGESPAFANHYLETHQWDLHNAVDAYFYSDEEPTAEAQRGAEVPYEPEVYTGPRTLDGRPAPAPAVPSIGSSSRSAAPPRQGIATLGSISGGSASRHGGHGHAHDDDDDENYEPGEEPRDLYAGGEKSALAVQDPSKRNDPRKVVNDIIKKARANAAKPGGESSTASPSAFRGAGQTLGDDNTPSQTIPGPHGLRPTTSEQGPTQTRNLHIWEDGFSVDDGPLHRFDDAQNAADLDMIRQGRAPLHLMNVAPDQPVDVQLLKHNEKYKAPPKVYKPFSGGGQRLGSPTPSGPSTTTAPPPVAATPPIAPSSASGPDPEIDVSQPTVSLRIQLANGIRLPARFNTTHTIGDVYGFIDRAYPGSSERPWVLATTFPNKDHTNKSLELGDVSEFKRGGTAVQKWT